MDPIVEKIFQHSREVGSKSLELRVLDEIKKRVADSIITSYGAMNAPPVLIEKKALLPSSGKYNSPVYFTGQESSLENATFINGSMTRYLDYNDTYLSKEALHPSDNVPPILSMGYAMELDGGAVSKAASVAYDVVGALSDAVSIRDRGWDHVAYISISSAAGLGNLLDFNERKFENLLNLAINNNISLRQTRAGELSMWKGCTAADASRNSVFASLLAMEGFTGPSPIFTGEMGFFKQVSGHFDLEIGEGKVLRTMIKNFPVEYHAMSAAEVALNLRDKIKGQIKQVNVETFDVAHTIIIKDPEKLRPKTRETADHSMPYIVAYTLKYGAPTPNAYDDVHLKDNAILSIIDVSKYNVTQKFNDMYPENLPVKIEVVTDSGTFQEEMDVPKGHFRKPYTWEDLENKGKLVMGEDNSKILMDFMKHFESRPVRELFEVISDVHFKG